MTMTTDLYQQVTGAIVQELEKGVAPWVKPWRILDQKFGGLPFNGATKRGYRGVNVLLLLIASMKGGYQDPRWFTFRQVSELGGHVKRGEKSTRVVFWKEHTFKKEEDGTGEENEVRVALLRSYPVFNALQCDGVLPLPGVEEREVEVRYERARALFLWHGVDLRVGAEEAYFSPEHDYIRAPSLEAFESEECYWGTLLHELTHWSGHETRLNRDLSSRFGTEAYAMEELVAEMGSAFLCATLGIEGRLRHPEYIASWLKVLGNDSRAVFKAASLAQAAADYLLRQETEESSDSPPIEEAKP